MAKDTQLSRCLTEMDTDIYDQGSVLRTFGAEECSHHTKCSHTEPKTECSCEESRGG